MTTRLRPSVTVCFVAALVTATVPLVSAQQAASAKIWVDRAPEIEAYYSGRPLMLQPFERGIVEEGEFSMVYLNGAHSHSILKVPKRGDFRVQEEHGSEIIAIAPQPALLAAGDAAISAVGEKLLYARADFVRSGDVFRLMELELVEPALYLRTDPAAEPIREDAVSAAEDR